MEESRKQAIDLFCGCGGMSAGLRLAGYEVIAGLDIEKKFIATFSHNFPTAISIVEDIFELSPEDFSNRINVKPGELDLLVGGPPCQGFSKNVPRKNRFLEDPKNRLVKSFLDYAEYFMPDMIIMENVAEMKNGFDGKYTEEIVMRLEAVGYSVSHAVLNAADYGVPQRRKRAFFFANRFGIKFNVPKPTHIAPSNAVNFSEEKKHVSVWEAISDLPSLKPGEGEEDTLYATQPQSKYQHMVRCSTGKVKNHIAKKLNIRQYQRIEALEPGQGHKDLPEHLKVKGGYSGAYGRLTKNMIAPTITRWVFHPGSGRWGHPTDIRILSIREVARIQGFTDDYNFVGTYTQQAGQLGNAVPPILVKNIIIDFNKQIEYYKSSRKSMNLSKEIFSSCSGRSKSIA